MKKTFTFLFPLVALILAGVFYFLRLPPAVPPTESGSWQYKLLRNGNQHVFPYFDEVSPHMPLSIANHIGLVGDTKVFDVTYKIDEWALRIEERNFFAKEHLIVGGCNLVFGDALPDTETLTAHLQMLLPERNTINFSHMAGGLHTQLRSLELIPLEKLLPQASGTYVYVFYDQHINRWIGNPSYLNYAQPEAVSYRFKKGKLERMKLKDTQEWKTFEAVKAEGTEQVYMKLNQNLVWSKETLSSFVAGVVRLRQEYLKRFPLGKFVLAVHPLYSSQVNINKLEAALRKEKISFVNLNSDMQAFFTKEGKSYQDFKLPVVQAPNGDFNRALAAILAKKLKGL